MKTLLSIQNRIVKLKAFYRLAERLKKEFPQLKICLLLDSLYAADPVFKMIDNYNWKHIIIFKEGSMPKTYEECLSLEKLQKNREEIIDSGIIQKFNWVNDISYRGPVFDILTV